MDCCGRRGGFRDKSEKKLIKSSLINKNASFWDGWMNGAVIWVVIALFLKLLIKRNESMKGNFFIIRKISFEKINFHERSIKLIFRDAVFTRAGESLAPVENHRKVSWILAHMPTLFALNHRESSKGLISDQISAQLTVQILLIEYYSIIIHAWFSKIGF